MLTISLPAKKQVKGCFFDLDGTLEDTVLGILATVKYICQLYQIPYAGDKALRPYAGEGLIYLMRLCQKNLSEDILQQGFASGLAYYQKEAYRYNKPFAGVAELLIYLEKNNITWGIVTNKIRSIIQRSLDHLPSKPKSNLVICADDLPRHKPDPLPLIEICNRSHILPSEAIFVGDSLNDMKTAQSAGVDGIFVTYGYGNYKQIQAAGITSGIINHLDELRRWLISIN